MSPASPQPVPNPTVLGGRIPSRHAVPSRASHHNRNSSIASSSSSSSSSFSSSTSSSTPTSPSTGGGFSPGAPLPQGFSYLTRSHSLVTPTRRSVPQGMLSSSSSSSNRHGGAVVKPAPAPPTAPAPHTLGVGVVVVVGDNTLKRLPPLPATTTSAVTALASPPAGVTGAAAAAAAAPAVAPRRGAPMLGRSKTVHDVRTTTRTDDGPLRRYGSGGGDDACDVAAMVAQLPPNPKQWTPSQVALYLTHVLGLTPRPVVEDVTAYVRRTGMGGRAFLRLRLVDLEAEGLNLKWRRLMVEAVRKLRRDCLKGRIWGFEGGVGSGVGGDDGADGRTFGGRGAGMPWPRGHDDDDDDDDVEAADIDGRARASNDATSAGAAAYAKGTLKRMRDKKRVRTMIQTFESASESGADEDDDASGGFVAILGHHTHHPASRSGSRGSPGGSETDVVGGSPASVSSPRQPLPPIYGEGFVRSRAESYDNLADAEAAAAAAATTTMTTHTPGSPYKPRGGSDEIVAWDGGASVAAEVEDQEEEAQSTASELEDEELIALEDDDEAQATLRHLSKLHDGRRARESSSTPWSPSSSPPYQTDGDATVEARRRDYGHGGVGRSSESSIGSTTSSAGSCDSARSLEAPSTPPTPLHVPLQPEVIKSIFEDEAASASPTHVEVAALPPSAAAPRRSVDDVQVASPPSRSVPTLATPSSPHEGVGARGQLRVPPPPRARPEVFVPADLVEAEVPRPGHLRARPGSNGGGGGNHVNPYRSSTYLPEDLEALGLLGRGEDEEELDDVVGAKFDTARRIPKSAAAAAVPRAHDLATLCVEGEAANDEAEMREALDCLRAGEEDEGTRRSSTRVSPSDSPSVHVTGATLATPAHAADAAGARQLGGQEDDHTPKATDRKAGSVPATPLGAPDVAPQRGDGGDRLGTPPAAVDDAAAAESAVAPEARAALVDAESLLAAMGERALLDGATCAGSRKATLSKGSRRSAQLRALLRAGGIADSPSHSPDADGSRSVPVSRGRGDDVGGAATSFGGSIALRSTHARSTRMAGGGTVGSMRRNGPPPSSSSSARGARMLALFSPAGSETNSPVVDEGDDTNAARFEDVRPTSPELGPTGFEGSETEEGANDEARAGSADGDEAPPEDGDGVGAELSVSTSTPCGEPSQTQAGTTTTTTTPELSRRFSQLLRVEPAARVGEETCDEADEDSLLDMEPSPCAGRSKPTDEARRRQHQLQPQPPLLTAPGTSATERIAVPYTSLEPSPDGRGSLRKRSMVLVERERLEGLARRMGDLERQLAELDEAGRRQWLVVQQQQQQQQQQQESKSVGVPRAPSSSAGSSACGCSCRHAGGSVPSEAGDSSAAAALDAALEAELLDDLSPSSVDDGDRRRHARMRTALEEVFAYPESEAAQRRREERERRFEEQLSAFERSLADARARANDRGGSKGGGKSDAAVGIVDGRASASSRVVTTPEHVDAVEEPSSASSTTHWLRGLPLTLGAIPGYALGVGAGIGFVLVSEVLGRAVRQSR